MYYEKQFVHVESNYLEHDDGHTYYYDDGTLIIIKGSLPSAFYFERMITMIILSFVYLVFDTDLFIVILLKENIGKLYIAIALYRLGDATFNS